MTKLISSAIPVENIQTFGKIKLYETTTIVAAIQIDHKFNVETPEGIIYCNKGDYLCIREGEYWPVRQDIFEKTHEKIKNE